MSRLPIVGGDSNSWGNVLNDYLTETAQIGVLSSSPTVNATQFDLAVVPTGMTVGSVVAIDAFTTECELRSVTSVTGQTIGVAATKYAHASGDTVLVINDGAVTPSMYGMTDGTADNWGPMQRMVIESGDMGMKAKHRGALAGNVWSVAKPICVETSSMWEDIGLRTHASYAPVDLAGALCMVANRSWPFTADAATNVFTVSGGHGMGGPGGYSEVNHTKIVFSNPYAETLPGGITAGQVYYIDTTPSGTTFTVSATQGGAILDVTVSGAGMAWEGVEELSRVYWDNVRFDLTVADVCGLRLSMQQPAYIRNIRVEMDSAATAVDTVFGIAVTGQIGYIDNVEVNPEAKCTGMAINGTGIIVRGFNCNGVRSNDRAIKVTGDMHSIHDPWTEQVAVAGIHLAGQARGITISGSWHFSGNANEPALLVDSVSTAYSVGQVRAASGSALYINDTGRGLSLTGWDGGTGGDTDTGLVFAGMEQSFGAVAPVLGGRRTAHLAADYTVTRQYHTVRMDTSGGNKTVTLPTAVGWLGWGTTVVNAVGPNTVTVDPTGVQTIGGAATLALAPGEAVSVCSDGANYYITGRG